MHVALSEGNLSSLLSSTGSVSIPRSVASLGFTSTEFKPCSFTVVLVVAVTVAVVCFVRLPIGSLTFVGIPCKDLTSVASVLVFVSFAVSSSFTAGAVAVGCVAAVCNDDNNNT